MCRLWGSTPKIGFWEAVRGTKVIPSDSPPSICYTVLESSEYLQSPATVSVSLFSWGSVPQNWSLGGHLGGQEWYHRIARLWFAKTLLRSSDYLEPFSSYSVASFRDIHTYTHTQNLDSIMAILR